MTQVNPLTNPVYTGPTADTQGLYSAIKPVRYRYVMAYLHAEKDADGVVHQPGEVLAVMPMTSVTYRVGMYAGTDMEGTVYLPGMYLDLMAYPPVNGYDRWKHPDQQGTTLGSQFECGNRALYVMRNEKVVWGGILWARAYSSGNPTMQISGISFDGYAYYRWLRRSIKFTKEINQYTIWYAVLRQMLMDFTWKGHDTGKDKPNGKPIYENRGFDDAATEASRIIKNPTTGKITGPVNVPWTGLTRNNTSNYDAATYVEVWPKNSPDIELPPETLKYYSDYPANKAANEVKVSKEWRGYDLHMVGQALEEWADTETISSIGGGNRFEYRVVCWFDSTQQRFRQRYVFGEMDYDPDPAKSDNSATGNNPKPIGIKNRLLGANSQEDAKGADNQLVFDYPGHISAWSLNETMDGGATRVVVTDELDNAEKHSEYAVDKLLNVPTGDGSQGWLLYDQTATWGITANVLAKLKARAERLLELYHVPEAQQLIDFITAEEDAASSTQRTSLRSTSLSISLYTDPTNPLPAFEVGDWAAFAIEDPFYGGTMYLVRRIMGYTVTVVPDQESDYSHEQYELELTDDSQVEIS